MAVKNHYLLHILYIADILRKNLLGSKLVFLVECVAGGNQKNLRKKE